MTCRLLLADDHAQIRVGVRAMVNDLEGYEVVGEAEDGEQAVEMAERLKPDIILLDISMHGVDGLEALQRLGTRVPESRVLMLSMHTDAEVERHRLFEAVGDLFDAASTSAPIVLVLDDIHWADKP